MNLSQAKDIQEISKQQTIYMDCRITEDDNKIYHVHLYTDHGRAKHESIVEAMQFIKFIVPLEKKYEEID